MAHITKINKSWKAEVSLGVDANGNRLRKAKNGFRTKREAIEWSESESLKHRNGTNSFDKKVPLKDFMVKWYDEICSLKSENTRYNNLSRMNHHIIPDIGHIPLNELTVSAVQTFYNNLALKNLAPSSKKKILETLSSSLTYAYKLKLIPYVPCDIEKQSIRKVPIKYFTQEEVNFILAELKDSWCYLPVIITVTTGIRPAELMGLQWEHVDLSNRKIIIKQQVIRQKEKNSQSRLLLSNNLKTASSYREITIPKFLCDEFLNKKNSTTFNKRSNFVITTRDGQINSPDLLRTMFNKAFIKIQASHRANLKKEGYTSEDIESLVIKKIPFYNFRHTNATLMLNNKIDIKIISERLGHSSVKTTYDTYSAILPKYEKETADVLEEMFKDHKR